MEKEIDLIVFAQLLWENKLKIVKWTIAGIIVGVIVAYSIPREYDSIVKVAPEGQTKAGSSLNGLASIIGVNTSQNKDGINENIYPEIIGSTPFLLEFADIKVENNDEVVLLSDFMLKEQKHPWWKYVFGFPSRVMGWVSSIGKEKTDTITIKNSIKLQYDFAAIMSQSININMDPKTGIITITSTFQNPSVAELISDSLTVKLQRFMTTYRTSKTRANLVSNTRMMEEAKTKYYEADDKLATALDRNRNLNNKSGAAVMIERLQAERDLTYQVYQQLASQVSMDLVKLQEDTPVITIIEPATTPLYPSAPKKMIILAAFAILAAFVCSCTVIFKTLFANNKSNE